MQNEIIINAELGETRVALLENNQFAELHIERGRDKSVVGNVVKGKVSRVLPGMQAAFVDIGLEKAAFLYVGDYFESILETGETDGEPGSRRGGKGGGGRGRGRAAPPRIDTVLREGQEIIVQIAKEPIGTKGARITSSISIPGRHLVLTPWSRRVGVSRRIGSDKERRRLREIVEKLRPKNLGFIIRTAGDGVREADLQADIRYLATVWAAIQQRHAENAAPALLYSEHDLPLRIVRDVAGHDTKRIVTDDKAVFEAIEGFVDRFVADPKPSVEHYQDSLPIFERFDLETQIHANLERKVWLKSGGSLVIDKSEALTAIDVNTGRFVGKRDLEETVFKTNLEAVQEVVHQLRFRNLGGLIIIDLIDMESAGNREKVYRALQDALRADKARTNILKISELGLVEMTRKRTRENLVQTLCEPCGYCEGRSYVLSRESVAFRVLREVRKHISQLKGRPIAISVNPHVAEELLTKSKEALAALSEEIGKDIEVRARPSIHQEQYELSVLEPGPAVALNLPWIQDTHPDTRPKEKAKGKAEEDTQDGEDEGKRGGRRRSTRGRGRSNDEEENKSEKGEGTDDSETVEKPAARKSRGRRTKTPTDDDATDTPETKDVADKTDSAESSPAKSRSRRGRRSGGAAAAAGKFETMSLDDDDYVGSSAGSSEGTAGSKRDRGDRKSGDSAEATEVSDDSASPSSEKRPRTRRPRRGSEASSDEGSKAASTSEATSDDSVPETSAEPRGRASSKKPVSDAAAAAAIYERLDSFDADAEPDVPPKPRASRRRAATPSKEEAETSKAADDKGGDDVKTASADSAEGEPLKPRKSPARKRAARKAAAAGAPEDSKTEGAPDSDPAEAGSDPKASETAAGEKS